MDIGKLSMAMANTELATAVSTKVLDMSLENVETSGDSIKKMLELSVQPNLGANLDISI